VSDRLIVIPAFNEARTIADVVTDARRHGPVLVVDDGSGDRTSAAARGADADVLELRRRSGKGAALRAGVEVARQRGVARVITLDADGQHDPGDIPLLFEAARGAPRAIVVGGRLRNAVGMPSGRRNACRVAGFFINWITDAPIRDTQSGFRSYPLPLFDEVTLRRGGFVLETEVLLASARTGRPIVEVDLSTARPSIRGSRFHPLADGCAIGAYLAARVAGHCIREAGEAGREVARVFDRTRRRARHAEMAEAGARFPDAPHLYGFAAGGVAVRHARTRVLCWWRHPRRRRMTLVLQAIGLSPLLLALALAQPLLNRLGVDLVTPFVDRFYSQERLAVAAGAITLHHDLEVPFDGPAPALPAQRDSGGGSEGAAEAPSDGRAVSAGPRLEQ